jgi:hypothetical protein
MSTRNKGFRWLGQDMLATIPVFSAAAVFVLSLFCLIRRNKRKAQEEKAYHDYHIGVLIEQAAELQASIDLLYGDVLLPQLGTEKEEEWHNACHNDPECQKYRGELQILSHPPADQTPYYNERQFEYKVTDLRLKLHQYQLLCG